MADRRRTRAAGGAEQTDTHPLLSAAVIGAAYLLGSIPSGIFLARRAGVDVRKVGSGNIGATNVARSVGWRLGAAALVADACKGALPVAFCLGLGFGIPMACVAALAAVGGHLFPVFAGFRGGKGVATTLGVLIVLAPKMALAAVAVFVVLMRATRFVSAGSLAAALVLSPGLYVFGYPRVVVATGAALSLAIIWRHRDNIARLFQGTELRM